MKAIITLLAAIFIAPVSMAGGEVWGAGSKRLPFPGETQWAGSTWVPIFSCSKGKRFKASHIKLVFDQGTRINKKGKVVQQNSDSQAAVFTDGNPDFTVVFGNGTEQNFNVGKGRLKMDSPQTNWKNLRGHDDRCVKGVLLHGRSKSRTNGKRAKVNVMLLDEQYYSSPTVILPADDVVIKVIVKINIDQ